MNLNPLVSVIIPCFNSTRYLAEAIESVLGQSYTNLEVLMVDDCSTDGTVDMIKGYQHRDARIRLIQRRTRGGRPAITKNTGLEHVTGEYVCFLDHDDYYHPERIEILLQLLQTHPDCVAAFHDIDLVDAQGNFLARYLEGFPEKAQNYLKAENNGIYVSNDDFFAFQSIKYAAMHTISVMVSLNKLSINNIMYDTRYTVCDDTDLWIRLGMAGRLVYTERQLAYYRQHETNITRNQIQFKQDTLMLLLNNYFRVKHLLKKTERAQLRTRIANAYNDLGWNYRQQYLPAKSIPAYFKAFLWSGNPLHILHAAKALLPARDI